jgi:RsiW-degrading membrane proteinase PrsW (M82 family)
LWVGLLIGVLSGATFLVAELSDNWTVAPTGVFLGAMAGPFAFAVWLTDRTRVGRSVPPDLLFVTWLGGGGFAILFTGFFESEFFRRGGGQGYLWVGLVEETAKLIVPLAVCAVVPRCRSVEQALALAVATAAGFAAFESMTFALYALDESGRAARRVLLERTFVTPFGHLPWTGIAVVVAATAWRAAGRVRLTPAALWGFGAAVVLHTSWNIVLVNRGWWSVLIPVIAAITATLFLREVHGVYYDGPYAIPADHYADRRSTRHEGRGLRDESGRGASRI